MLTPTQIREKKISTVEAGGYDRKEVNVLLLEIIESYEAVFNENKELYRKMEVLANRIEEYRADEDSIKTALISAQKMASQLTKDAKAQADKTISESSASAHQTVIDAREKADRIIGEAREYVSNFTKEKVAAADEILAEAQQKANDAIDGAKSIADDVLTQAKKLAKEIVSKANAEKEYLSDVMTNLKEESADFKSTLINLYESQLEMLENLDKTTSIVQNDSNIENFEKELDDLIDNIDCIIGSEDVLGNTDYIQEAEDISDENAEEAESEYDEISEDEEYENFDGSDLEQDADDNDFDQEDADDYGNDEFSDDEIGELEVEDCEYYEDDEIVDESENTYAPLHEAVINPPTEEEVTSAIDAFSTDEITPIDDTPSIPLIEDEPEFESAMAFESFFKVNKGEGRTDETISLIPPDDEEDDEDNKFKGFFKKKK